MLLAMLPLAALTACSEGPPAQTYVFTQNVRAFRLMETCQDMFNAVADMGAHDRLRAHYEAHDYHDWDMATRVVIDSGDRENDVYIMAKTENGDTGCVSSALLKSAK